MIVPTCARCDRPFPANNELTALPHGKRVAFDPELGRVWRICTKCGEWNAVGPEAAPAVARELHVRLTTIERGAIVHDAVGGVDVLTVTTAPDALPVSGDALQARRSLARFKRLDWVVTGSAILVVVWLLVEPGVTRSDWNATFRVLSQACASGGAFLLGHQLARIGRGGPRFKWLGLCGVLFALHALFATVAGPDLIRWTMIPIMTALGFALYRSRLFNPPINMLNSATLRLHDGEVAEAWLGYDPARDQMIAGIPSRDLEVHGADAHALIYGVAARTGVAPGSRDTEHAWAILRSSRGIDGVLQSLDAARPEGQGRHRLGELPAPWRLALLFGIVEDSGTLEEREQLRDQIAAASEVAAIAESLDRGE